MTTRILSIILLMTIGIGRLSSQVLYNDHEYGRNTNYYLWQGDFYHFSQNPSPSGENTSSHVAKYVEDPTYPYNFIIFDPGSKLQNLSDYVNSVKQMSIQIYSPAAGLELQIAIMDTSITNSNPYPTGYHSMYTATTTKANEWETLTFNFFARPDASVEDNNCHHVSLLFAPNILTQYTFYIDNFMGPEFTDPCPTTSNSHIVLEDFECERNLLYPNMDGILREITNPEADGINSTDYAAIYFHSGNSTDYLVIEFKEPLALDTYNAVEMHVNGPKDDILIFTLLDNNDMPLGSATATFQLETDWEIATFDFSSLTGNTTASKAIIEYLPQTTNNIFGLDEIRLIDRVSSIHSKNPVGFQLHQNTPNPFQNITHINFDLKRKGLTELKIIDHTGKIVAQPIQETHLPRGQYSISFNSTELSPGIYLYTLKVDGVQVSRKMILQ